MLSIQLEKMMWLMQLVNKMCIRDRTCGSVGYVAASIKNVGDCAVGDTITSAENGSKEPLPGYRKDVYKRQAQDRWEASKHCPRAVRSRCWDTTLLSVSYTHLDVYKRQVFKVSVKSARRHI